MARPRKTIVNPDFLADEDVQDAVAEAILTRETSIAPLVAGLNPDSASRFAIVDGMYSALFAALPHRYGFEIPDEGAWIIVKTVPYTGLPWEVPVHSIWRATPTYRRTELRLKTPRRTKVDWPMLRAVIQTPGGELHLYPGEYVTTDIEKWLEFIGEGLSLNFLGAGEPAELVDQLFYLRAHGIKSREALALVLPSLTEDSFAYLTFDEC